MNSLFIPKETEIAPDDLVRTEKFCKADGSDYRGSTSFTASGKPCVSWASAGYSGPGYESNLCRNRDGMKKPYLQDLLMAEADFDVGRAHCCMVLLPS